MKFKQPFFVSPHAIIRFRERVADLSAARIIIIVQAALQDNRQAVGVQIYNHKSCPVLKAKYLNVDYLIPVIDTGRIWPIVPTILLPGMRDYVLRERSGWNWKS